jgi:hypothetical protein
MNRLWIRIKRLFGWKPFVPPPPKRVYPIFADTGWHSTIHYIAGDEFHITDALGQRVRATMTEYGVLNPENFQEKVKEFQWYEV